MLLEEVRKGHLDKVHTVKSKQRGQKGPDYCRFSGLKLAQPYGTLKPCCKSWNYF